MAAVTTRAGGWVVGVDRGGTWLRVAAIDSRGRRRRERREAPTLARLPAALRATWRGWRLRRGDVTALVVASRGVWTAGERLALTRSLRALAPSVHVLSDVEAAHLGALGDRAGLLLLAGTGSIALGRDGNGRFVRAGGLGPLLGDEGSGFWIGREWLRARVGASSSSTPKSARALALARRLQQGDHPATRIAALAPAVLRLGRRGDRLARAVVDRAQEELAALLAGVLSGRSRVKRLPVSWAGGLMADAGFRSGVWRAARRAGLRLTPTAPRGTPLDATLALAASRARAARPRPARAGRPDLA
jgi:glucosamine kinase